MLLTCFTSKGLPVHFASVEQLVAYLEKFPDKSEAVKKDSFRQLELTRTQNETWPSPLEFQLVGWFLALRVQELFLQQEPIEFGEGGVRTPFSVL